MTSVPSALSQPAADWLTAELRSRLRAEFSYLTDADLDAASVLGAGWSATALHVGPLVVRLPKDAASAARLAVEARLLAALQAREVAGIPRDARAMDGDGPLLAATHRYVDGPSVRALRLRGAPRALLARRLGGLLGAAHSFPAARAHDVGVEERDLWADQYVPMIEACRPHLDTATLAWLDALCERFVAASGTSKAPRVLVHGDLGAEHIRVRPDGTLAGVIDWESAMVADPAIDFAGLRNHFSWPFVERVLARYTGPRNVLDDPDLRRRADFYVTVVPLFSVEYGARCGDAAELRAGRAKLAARARAASRT